MLRAVESSNQKESHFQSKLLVARDDFIAEQPTLLRKLLREDLNGAEDCTAHVEETTAMVCETMQGFDPATVEQAVTRAVPIWNTRGTIDVIGLAVAVGTMHTLGAIAKKLDPQMLVDLSDLSGQ